MRRSRFSAVPLFAAFIALCFMPALAARARIMDDSVCDSYPNIDVNITPVFDEPQINTSHALSFIQELAQSPNKVVAPDEAVTLGIARYEPVIEFHAPMLKRSMSDGTTCARVEEIDAVIGYRNVTIYIANELVGDTCAMQHVLEHEKKHIAVNRSLLFNYVPSIQKKLTDYLHNNGLYRGSNPDYAESLMREKISFVLQETAKQIVEENRRRQQLIDTPEEYARNKFVCGGRINTIVSKANATRE